jgi:hypothetical protein
LPFVKDEVVDDEPLQEMENARSTSYNIEHGGEMDTTISFDKGDN